jgi:predicted O-linked N-acetylglucosamine transferase (SPINDLY family)
MTDVASLLAVVDVYLASFPNPGDLSVLDAMGAGKPVVVLRYPAGTPYNSAAELVGVPELLAARETEYGEIAMRLIRDGESREKASAAVSARFAKEFHPDSLASRYLTGLERVHRGGAEDAEA